MCKTPSLYKYFYFSAYKGRNFGQKIINVGKSIIFMKLNDDEKHVLRVLYNNGCWGNGAMYARNIVHRGAPVKILDRLEKELRLISKFKHRHGWKYFLVKEKRDEIEETLGITNKRGD